MTVATFVEPRICSVPEYVSSSGYEAIELASLAGLELDEWQQMVLIGALGERADGKWAAPTVGLVVGRQNGKNAVLEAVELAGLFLLGEKTIVHSAHEQATSSEHFMRILALIESVPEFDRRVLRAPRGKGAEAIELRGGQRILFKTRTGGGGRGFTVDRLVFDEAMILSAAAKAALIPTLAGRSAEGNMQIWYAGSAVDQLNPKHDGLELARVRAAGIAKKDRVAYFEWSAPGNDPGKVPVEVSADRDVWAMANPGLGIRISEEWVEHERTVELGAREFAVERLGIGDWPDPEGADAVIDPEVWGRLADSKARLVDPVDLCFDVAPDRSVSSISAAALGADRRPTVELIERERGTAWVVSRIVELVAKHKPSSVVCDAAGAAGSLVYELEQAGVVVKTVNAREHAEGCGMLFDAVANRSLRHLGQQPLMLAVRGARKRKLGGAWAWDRDSSAVDITPLVSSTLALWAVLSRVQIAPRVVSLNNVPDE